MDVKIHDVLKINQFGWRNGSVLCFWQSICPTLSKCVSFAIFGNPNLQCKVVRISFVFVFRIDRYMVFGGWRMIVPINPASTFIACSVIRLISSLDTFGFDSRLGQQRYEFLNSSRRVFWSKGRYSPLV
mgnify:CR=1 FL=1